MTLFHSFYITSLILYNMYACARFVLAHIFIVCAHLWKANIAQYGDNLTKIAEKGLNVAFV